VARGVAVDFGQQHRELVAAQPRDQVRRARDAEQCLRGGPQRRLAGVVAVAIVELLEMVRVEQQDRHRVPVATRSPDLEATGVEEVSPVRQPGQVVARGAFVFALEQLSRSVAVNTATRL
jgi:hypothetical protein